MTAAHHTENESLRPCRMFQEYRDELSCPALDERSPPDEESREWTIGYDSSMTAVLQMENELLSPPQML